MLVNQVSDSQKVLESEHFVVCTRVWGDVPKQDEVLHKICLPIRLLISVLWAVVSPPRYFLFGSNWASRGVFTVTRVV